MSAPTPAPVSSRDESYHTRHAPFGAFASFIIGLIAACGGFGQSLHGPANQNVYVGFLPAGQLVQADIQVDAGADAQQFGNPGLGELARRADA